MTRDGTVGRSDGTERNLPFHWDIDPARVMRPRFADSIRASSPENRPGAGGVIGTRAAAKTAPDGYTLVMMVTLASLPANAGYDLDKDFAPVGLIASTPIVVMAHPSFPAKSLNVPTAAESTAVGAGRHSAAHRRLNKELPRVGGGSDGQCTTSRSPGGISSVDRVWGTGARRKMAACTA